MLHRVDATRRARRSGMNDKVVQESLQMLKSPSVALLFATLRGTLTRRVHVT